MMLRKPSRACFDYISSLDGYSILGGSSTRPVALVLCNMNMGSDI